MHSCEHTKQLFITKLMHSILNSSVRESLGVEREWMHFDVYNNVFEEVKVLFFHLFYVFQSSSTHLTRLGCSSTKLFLPWIFRYDITLQLREYLLTSLLLSEMVEKCWNTRTWTVFSLAAKTKNWIHKMLLSVRNEESRSCLAVWKQTIYHWHTKMLRKRSFILRKLFKRENISISIEFSSFLKGKNMWSKQLASKQQQTVGEEEFQIFSTLACKVEHEISFSDY